MGAVPTPVVVALLLNRKRVFLIRRPANGPLANRWEFPGGKVEYGESPTDALRRELREELGARPSRLVLFGAYSHVYGFPTGAEHYVLLAYRSNVTDGPWSKRARGRWMDGDALTAAMVVEGSRPIVTDVLAAGLVRPPGAKRRPLWTCPKCGRRFANRNQWHSCGRFTVEQHLKGKNRDVIELYERFADLVKQCGPVIVTPAKTRIGFLVQMTFAVVTLRSRWLDAHVCLSRRLENPRVRRIESFGRIHVHHFRIRSFEELDEEVAAWLCEAYEVGERHHLSGRAFT